MISGSNIVNDDEDDSKRVFYSLERERLETNLHHIKGRIFAGKVPLIHDVHNLPHTVEEIARVS